MSDLKLFVEGIDTESCSYKYINSLNQFRIELEAQVQMQKTINDSGPFKEAKFIAMVERYHVKLPMLLF